ncbi:sigma-70 family RNA polymerase sigma factor [Allopusillimonas soli]|uniref:Sigma-70 family RNA polymerase sigma factor n=1 Tax=Allopusillimonas soli TaxID=659016 RepID=A0A853FCL8_9BURK|nr:sigma-70 family RNA polymerase sigma factor [Allopusillimonas soli]NYT37649.1 sigma-70 family RNA polymerase sigma factor [Allopusillimonas soli]TEA74390.1 sigma-70 family RNA polymerase sigma factor [Allopusillimonas soli]
MSTHHYQELFNFCTRSLGDRHAAADVVQEVYARFLAMRNTQEHIQDARALLYRIARNLLVDQHRRSMSHSSVAWSDWDEEPHSVGPEYMQPERIHALSEHARVLMQAIEDLPPRCREAFILNRFEGLSHQEVAERMGISRNMVAQHIIRAMLACKAREDAYLRA